MDSNDTERVKGFHAVLGVDIVVFSTLINEDQLLAIEFLIKWVHSALDYHEIRREDYHWSPAGDGGYLTFKTSEASNKAIDIAFSVLEKARRPSWVPRTGDPIELRFGLHAGVVRENDELAGGTNVWGDGINLAARVLGMAANSQVLVSNQYFDTFLRNRREHEFSFGRPFPRTVKHGVRIFVRNSRRGDLGLHEFEETALRWYPIGAIWRNAVESYMHLIDDAIESDDPVAAVAATKFLLDLTSDSKEGDVKADEVFSAIGESSGEYNRNSLRHSLFNVIPSSLLRKIIEDSVPKLICKGSVLCYEGEKSVSSFLLVYGTLLVEGSNIPHTLKIPPGQIVGEFSLWIPDSQRTATIRAGDDSLVLEIPHHLFIKICQENSDIAVRVYSLIKRRLLENVLGSELFFPKIRKADSDRLLSRPSIVEKYPVGTRLNLCEKTYIIFCGRVRITPPMLNGGHYDIISYGNLSGEAIVGIKTQYEPTIDGEFAEVMEESVTININHEELFDIMQGSEDIETAWDAIWGRRRNNLMRALRGLLKATG